MHSRQWCAVAIALVLLGACSGRPQEGAATRTTAGPVDTLATDPSTTVEAGTASDGDWPYYGRSEAGLRYSPLTEITPQNVADLEIAWMYHIGGLPKVEGLLMPALEATPIVADGRMFLCSSTNRVVALDP